MKPQEPPVYLERARKEMLSALLALRPAEEMEHRSNAESLVVDALTAIRDNPDGDYDWTRMKMPNRQVH